MRTCDFFPAFKLQGLAMTSALLVIDMQMDMQFRLAAGREHVNPGALDKIARLLAHFRQQKRPVIHIRHADRDPQSPFHPDSAGYAPAPCAKEIAGEPVFIKTTSSGFASTDLANYLQAHGVDQLVVAGAVAGFCVNSTVRAGADLGIKMTVVKDAVLGFDLPSAGLSAAVIFDVTMALLEADFAEVVESAEVLSR